MARNPHMMAQLLLLLSMHLRAVCLQPLGSNIMCRLVGWSLTSLFSTNKAISETKDEEIYSYPVKEG